MGAQGYSAKLGSIDGERLSALAEAISQLPKARSVSNRGQDITEEEKWV
jgi:hypothetical protein